MEGNTVEFQKIFSPSNTHELLQSFQLQKQAYLTIGQTSYATRKMYLESLLKALNNYTEDLIQSVSQDFRHRSRHETKLFEIVPVIRAIRYTLKHLSEWMNSSNCKLPLWLKPAKARILPQALGVVGVYAAWNYPIQLSLMPLIAALSAGNRVMLKLSELTPQTNQLLAKMIGEIFALQDVQVVMGDAEVAEWFATLPFNHIFFTGSSRAGKKIMQAASQNLVPVTLELGGKSPAVVAPQYPLQQATDRILTGKLLNAGQTCIAPDYVFLPQGAETLFVEQAIQFVAKHYSNLINNDDYTAIINQAHYDRLTHLLHDAQDKGAQIIPLVEDVKENDSDKFIPQIILNVTQDMRIMQEEIFGPILPIMTYININDVVRYINEQARPLSLYLFDQNFRRVTDVLLRTVSGGVTINDTIWHAAPDELPFGGVGESGMGRYHGKAGFDTFTHYKSVFIQSDYSMLPLLRPPFKKWLERCSRFLV